MESAAVDLTPNIETSAVSIPPKEEAEKMERFRGLALAFENFNQNDNLDSFKGLVSDEAIETARGLLLKEDPLEVSKIKEQFLEYGNCLINEFKNENNKAQEKLEKLDGCKYGEALEKLWNEINVSLYSPSDSQSSS